MGTPISQGSISASLKVLFVAIREELEIDPSLEASAQSFQVLFGEERVPPSAL